MKCSGWRSHHANIFMEGRSRKSEGSSLLALSERRVYYSAKCRGRGKFHSPPRISRTTCTFARVTASTILLECSLPCGHGSVWL